MSSFSFSSHFVFITSIFMPFFMACQCISSSTDQLWITGAHATFYGDMHGNETMYGACGYEDLFKQGYGLETAALSTALFHDGLACGSCFEIQCINSPWCKPNVGTIKVTATNFCPPNYTKTVDIWCNPPQQHFDLSMPMFLKIAEYKAGVVPVKHRRVPCVKEGGIKFELGGIRDWLLVLVYNVGGAGDIVDVKIQGLREGQWVQMTRNWGQKWQVSKCMVGEALSFQVIASDGRVVLAENVVPPNWNFGQTFECNHNF